MVKDYANAKIYKLTSFETDKVYIGSTIKQYLCQRLCAHNTAFEQFLRGNMNFITSFHIIKEGDAKIELLEAYPCKDIDELRAREGHWIKKLKKTWNVVNKVIPKRTSKEYYSDNAEMLKNKAAKFREENGAYYSTWLESKNKDYKENLKKYHEAYRAEHRNKLIEYQRNYRIKKKKEKTHVESVSEGASS